MRPASLLPSGTISPVRRRRIALATSGRMATNQRSTAARKRSPSCTSARGTMIRRVAASSSATRSGYSVARTFTRTCLLRRQLGRIQMDCSEKQKRQRADWLGFDSVALLLGSWATTLVRASPGIQGKKSFTVVGRRAIPNRRLLGIPQCCLPRTHRSRQLSVRRHRHQHLSNDWRVWEYRAHCSRARRRRASARACWRYP